MDAKETFAASENTVMMFDHPNGGWGCVLFFKEMGLFYANPMDELRSGCYSKHFKTAGGAIRHMKRYGFVEA